MVQFDEVGARIGANYEIVRMTRNPPGDNEWQRVGLATKAGVHLESAFWVRDANLTASRSHDVIRIVTIAEDPLVIVSKPLPSQETECTLTEPCFKYVQVPDPRTNSTSVRPVKYCCSGYVIDVLHLLQRDLPNVRMEVYFVEDGYYGSYNPKTKQWNGMINDLVQGKADLALTALTINEIRAKAVDFSNAYLYGETKIMVSSREIRGGYIDFSFLEPFQTGLWIASVAIINIVLLIIWCFDRFSPFGHHNTQPKRRRHLFNISGCMSFVWSCVFKLQLDDVTPRSTSARVASAAFAFSTLILTTTYTANLAAYLVSIGEVVPVSSIRDQKVPSSLKPPFLVANVIIIKNNKAFI